MTPTITRDELLAKIKTREKVVIVEALPPMYYKKEHLPGAVNLPHDQIDELAPSLLPDKSAQIVVYCANTPCQNSTIATNRLIQLGYTNVKDYQEGKQDWIEAGLATESTRSEGQAA
jgi:rhodanese-related sulfurtransferase